MSRRKYFGPTEIERRKQAQQTFIDKFTPEEYAEYKRQCARRYDARSRAKRLKNKIVVTDELLKSITYVQTS